MSISHEELREGLDLAAVADQPAEIPWPHYEEVNLLAQGDKALVKKGGEPYLVVSFGTAGHSDPDKASRGRRLFIAVPLGENIILKRGEHDTWIGPITASGSIGETSVIFNETHGFYAIGDGIRLHFAGRDEGGARVGIESRQPLVVEPKPWNLNSKELLRVARLSALPPQRRV